MNDHIYKCYFFLRNNFLFKLIIIRIINLLSDKQIQYSTQKLLQICYFCDLYNLDSCDTIPCFMYNFN